jgi:hypothetical protein
LDLSGTPLNLAAGQTTGVFIQSTSASGIKWRNAGVVATWPNGILNLYTNDVKVGGSVSTPANFTGTFGYQILPPT